MESNQSQNAADSWNPNPFFNKEEVLVSSEEEQLALGDPSEMSYQFPYSMDVQAMCEIMQQMGVISSPDRPQQFIGTPFGTPQVEQPPVINAVVKEAASMII